jgi:hypothetical protein
MNGAALVALVQVSAGANGAAQLHIIIAGENEPKKERELGADRQPKENVGKVKAEGAALRCAGAAVLPSSNRIRMAAAGTTSSSSSTATSRRRCVRPLLPQSAGRCLGCTTHGGG